MNLSGYDVEYIHSLGCLVLSMDSGTSLLEDGVISVSDSFLSLEEDYLPDF